MKQHFRFRFDHFEIDSDLGLFHDSGIKIKLRPKEFAALCFLVRNNDKLIPKEELISAVWKNTYTSDESIARCISVIKSTLREASPAAGNLIRTEYGRGYRFIGKVSLLHNKAPLESSKQKKISDIVSRDILSCPPDTTVLESANLMHQHRKSSIIIYQHNRAIGIWTEADAMQLDFNNPKLFDCKVSSVMHSPVISIQEWKPLSDAVILMRSKGIRHLLVEDKQGRSCGVISQTDLVRNHGVESFLTVKDVKSVVYRYPLLITEDIPATEIVQRMRVKHTEIAIINLPGRDMFLFSERDLMQLLATKQIHKLASELSSRPLITVTEEMSLLSARQLMEIEQIRHLVVLDSEKKLLKVLGLADMLLVIEHSYVQLLEEILKQNEQVISEKEDHIQMLSNAVQQTAGMVLISNKFGELEYVNKSFETITGYTLDEVKGLNPRFLKSGTIPNAVYQNLWETIAAGKTWTGELCNRKKSGELYWVLTSLSPIFDDNNELSHYVAVEENITERINMENQLKEFEQRFLEIANSSPILLWESRADGKITFLNRSWVEFTGNSLEDLLGNGWAKQIHTNDLPNFLDAFHLALLKRESFTVDHRLQNAAGEYRWVMNSAKPRINERGQFLGFTGSCVDITERKTREMETQNLAYYDNLTGLATRHLFNDRLEQAISQAKRNKTNLALLYMDLDRFKPVNDLYGHLTGDALLQNVADRIRECIRKSDTVCRFGGDKFIILASQIPKKDNIDSLATKLIKAIENPFRVWGHHITISCSIGIALFPKDADNAISLTSVADNAMYAAKQLGRGKIVYSDTLKLGL